MIASFRTFCDCIHPRGAVMDEAFQVLRQFFVGASYSVFAVGCALAVISGDLTYYSFVGAFIFALLLLISAWIAALAERKVR